jgi:hypothetical protein
MIFSSLSMCLSRPTSQLSHNRRLLLRSISTLNAPTKNDQQELLRLLNNKPNSIISDDDSLEKYNTDWTVRYFLFCLNVCVLYSHHPAFLIRNTIRDNHPLSFDQRLLKKSLPFSNIAIHATLELSHRGGILVWSVDPFP